MKTNSIITASLLLAIANLERDVENKHDSSRETESTDE